MYIYNYNINNGHTFSDYLDVLFTDFIQPANRPLETSRCKLIDGIKIDLAETGCEVLNCIHLAQNRD
jgi:hypothetical protein